MANNDFYDSTGIPQSGPFTSAGMRAEFDLIQNAFSKFPILAGHAGEIVRVNPVGTALDTAALATIIGAIAYEDMTQKDQVDGYCGLDAFRLKLLDNAGSGISLLRNQATAARAWVLPDKSGTLADSADLTGKAVLAGQAFTGSPQAPTQAATDDSIKIASAAFVKSMVTYTNATKGRIRLHTGVTLQWGKIQVSAEVPYQATDTFLTPFTSSWTLGTCGYGATGATSTAGNRTTTQITVYASNASQWVYWWCIGNTTA